MNVYAPLFNKVVDSSLWLETDLVVKVFLTMLAKKDSDHVVRGNAFMIGQWSKKTEAEALEALAVLAAPDTKRLEPQPHEGRRIEKVEDGWLVLNGQAYEDLARKVARRFYKARKAREYREKEAELRRGRPLPGEQAFCKMPPEQQAHEPGNKIPLPVLNLGKGGEKIVLDK